jgi:hypothetical protein
MDPRRNELSLGSRAGKDFKGFREPKPIRKRPDMSLYLKVWLFSIRTAAFLLIMSHRVV